MRRSRFTLIELLVVVAIISVLAAMLLPALGRAKSHTYRVTCANNLKECLIAISLYKDDYGSVKPYPWWASYLADPYPESRYCNSPAVISTMMRYSGDVRIWYDPLAYQADQLNLVHNDIWVGLPFTASSPGYPGYNWWLNMSRTSGSTALLADYAQDDLESAPNKLVMGDCMYGRSTAGGHDYAAYHPLRQMTQISSFWWDVMTPLRPDGGNFAFVDGSARWFDFVQLKEVGGMAGNWNWSEYRPLNP